MTVITAAIAYILLVGATLWIALALVKMNRDE